MIDTVTKTEYTKAKKIVDTYHKIHSENEEQKHLKQLQSLVGKCFKFRNSYTDSERWWLYSKAIRMENGELLVETIQKDSDGKISIERNLQYLPHLQDNHIMISEKEYQKGVKPILEQLEMFIFV